MENIFFRLACFLAGYKYHILKKYHGYSQRKINVLAIGVMFPTFIWTLNGYFLTTNMLSKSVGNGILVALLLGIFMFFLERAILLSSGRKAIVIMRLCFAITSAFLGSVVLKSVIFESDINNKLTELRQAKIDQFKKDVTENYAATIALEKQNLKEDQASYDQNAKNVDDESKGKFTHHTGPGHLTDFYVKQRQVFDDKIKVHSAKLESLSAAIDKEVLKKTAQEITNEGLWAHIDAFYALAFQTTRGLVTFSMFFILLFCVEMLNLILKVSMPKSDYDLEEEHMSQIRRKNMLQYAHSAPAI
jgi:hypothetical protein